MDIGETIQVTVLAGAQERSAIGQDVNGWSFTLLSRQKRMWIAGESVKAWVGGIDWELRSGFAYVDDFGRLPISDRMRPRYLLAAQTALDSAKLTDLDEESRAELQGMFNRIVRRDQHDWFSVWCTLGRPDQKLVRAVVAFCRALCEARSKNETALEMPAVISCELRQHLAVAVQKMSNVSRTLKRGKSAPRARTKTPYTDRRVFAPYELRKLREANAVHSATLRVLKDYLASLGVAFEENAFVDLFARLKSGPAIFEVKSIHDANETAQARAALSQLYEYRYLEQINEAFLWVMFSQQPKQSWIYEYFERDRDVRVLWLIDGVISGPSSQLLNESGSAARQRKAAPTLPPA